MASQYVTGASDALDLICLRHYGERVASVAAVLEANPHIKDVAHALPMGVEITLPDLQLRGQAGQPLRLWS